MTGFSMAGFLGAFGLGCAALLALPGAARAGDPLAGREKAHVCEMCHGLDGLAKIPEAPNLAGQNEQYLIRQLQAFKGGQRQNDMMSLIAPMLSPADMDNLAAYYSAIEVTISKIPGQ